MLCNVVICDPSQPKMALQPSMRVKGHAEVHMCRVEGSLSEVHLCPVESTLHFDLWRRCRNQYGAGEFLALLLNDMLLLSIHKAKRLWRSFVATMALWPRLFIALFILQPVSPPSFSSSLLPLLLPRRDGPTSL